MREREERLQGDVHVRVTFTSTLISRNKRNVCVPRRIKERHLKNLASLTEKKFKYLGEVYTRCEI